MNNNTSQNSAVSYEDYDYSDFWKGRDYENEADKIAIIRLLALIKGSHDKIIDVGGGMGRTAPLYENDWNQFVILDSSERQINAARGNIHNTKAQFMVGTVENIPFPDSSFDAALCVRTFHYVIDTEAAIGEIYRILKTGGYFILEIPNKLHFKNRISAIFGKDSQKIFSADPINIITNSSALFLNHNPKTIIKTLESNRFKIIETLSVSNFRSGFIKKIFPTSFLIKFEKVTQKILANSYFGPSIYFLARKSDS